MNLKERFLKYASFDTQSDEASQTYPSTAKQLEFSRRLVEEMKAIGMTEAALDEHGYATGTIPATAGREDRPVIGFIAHVDTSPDMSGANVRPRVIDHYNGEDIPLNDHLLMKVADFPELADFKGHSLVVTDGTTLLGADDKAGIAAIMTAAEHLVTHPGIAHGKIRLAFTPDEEIGRGVDFFDVQRFGATFAYTVDGGYEGELEYENFNAAAAKIVVQGKSVHPGYAKNKMINALQVLAELNALIPPRQRPEHTEGYEGFYHLTAMNGTVESATADYIIRDHDRPLFEQKKAHIIEVVEQLNRAHGEGTVTLSLKDQYYNMRQQLEPYPELINKAIGAMQRAGVTPIVRPIRGGTDGARLSYMGLPCPNIFTGGMNFHGKFEYCSLQSMERAMHTIVNLAESWGE
ncbi:MAG: peptidase T [Odoribacteraceae bacterium]|jgi:tripeptide aminopeptidase|nr:peptidase T [Odoribacteraceae bacterium]